MLISEEVLHPLSCLVMRFDVQFHDFRCQEGCLEELTPKMLASGFGAYLAFHLIWMLLNVQENGIYSRSSLIFGVGIGFGFGDLSHSMNDHGSLPDHELSQLCLFLGAGLFGHALAA